MRLRFLPLLALVLLAAPASAQTSPVTYDTVTVRPVGPGMTYYRFAVPAIPWSIDVLELDRTNPYLEIRAVEANDRRAGGSETVRSIASRLDAPEHRVVGAINGDFFGGDGDTNSAGISDGQVVRRERTHYPSVSFDVDNVASLTRPVVGGVVRTASATIPISGYNEPRGADALVLYNSFRGASTGTNAFGTEVLVRPLSDWVVNDTIDVRVENVEVGAGNMGIPDGWAVLSGHGAAADQLAGVSVSDTLRLYAEAAPGLPRLEDMVSGNPMLIHNGVLDPLDGSAFNNDRHPRTAVAFNADTTTIWFITVDGRQSASAGMSNFELRDFVVHLGATDALNLDGGGSTTMVIRGDVINSPSGAERSVGNALVAVSTAPLGPLARFQVQPTFASLFLGKSVQITFTGTDEHYNPIEIEPAGVSYSVDPALGTVTSGGLFTASSSKTAGGTGYVRVTYEGLADSVRVHVKSVDRIVVSPKDVVTDTTRTVPFALQVYDTAGLLQTLPASEIEWEVLDESVGSVTADGVFHGIAEGTTQVVAIYSETVRDTAMVSIEIGTGEVVLDPLDEVGDWTVSGQGVDEVTLEAVDDPAATGGRAFRVAYRFTRTATDIPIVFLHTDIPIFGVPNAVTARVRSDGGHHRVFYRYENGAGEPFAVSVPRYADDTEYAPMPGPFTRAVPSAALMFPVRFVAVEFWPSIEGTTVGETYEGELYFDDLRASYPAGATSTEGLPGTKSKLTFLALYPNPTRSSATLALHAGAPGEVRLVLYDMLGREIRTAYDGPVIAGDQEVRVDLAGLPSGMYVVRAEMEGADAAVKVVVVR